MKHTKPLMWIGITATTLIAALFIASLWQLEYCKDNFNDTSAPLFKFHSIRLVHGGVLAVWLEDSRSSAVNNMTGGPGLGWSQWVTRPEYVHVSSGPTSFTRICLPLWIPFLITAPLTAFLIYFHLRATLRTRAGNCPKCNYNLNGLPPTAPCPECGTTPRPSEVAP